MILSDGDRRIARELVKAQIASDAGKGIFRLDAKYMRRYKYLGYDYKVTAIKRAIDLIRASRDTIFRYYVVEALDQNEYSSIVAYFKFKYKEVWYQISFHTPMNLGEPLYNYVGSGMRMRWDKKSSHDTAILLTKFL